VFDSGTVTTGGPSTAPRRLQPPGALLVGLAGVLSGALAGALLAVGSTPEGTCDNVVRGLGQAILLVVLVIVGLVIGVTTLVVAVALRRDKTGRDAALAVCLASFGLPIGFILAVLLQSDPCRAMLVPEVPASMTIVLEQPRAVEKTMPGICVEATAEDPALVLSTMDPFERPEADLWLDVTVEEAESTPQVILMVEGQTDFYEYIGPAQLVSQGHVHFDALPLATNAEPPGTPSPSEVATARGEITWVCLPQDGSTGPDW
jgi:hypothetical protein